MNNLKEKIETLIFNLIINYFRDKAASFLKAFYLRSDRRKSVN